MTGPRTSPPFAHRRLPASPKQLPPERKAQGQSTRLTPLLRRSAMAWARTQSKNVRPGSDSKLSMKVAASPTVVWPRSGSSMQLHAATRPEAMFSKSAMNCASAWAHLSDAPPRKPSSDSECRKPHRRHVLFTFAISVCLHTTTSLGVSLMGWWGLPTSTRRRGGMMAFLPFRGDCGQGKKHLWIGS